MQAEIDDSMAHNPFESMMDVTTADLEAELKEILGDDAESDEEIAAAVDDVRIKDRDQSKLNYPEELPLHRPCTKQSLFEME